LGKFKWPYLREKSPDPLHVWFYQNGNAHFISGRQVASDAGRIVPRLPTLPLLLCVEKVVVCD